jgi:hypothetical protein
VTARSQNRDPAQTRQDHARDAQMPQPIVAAIQGIASGGGFCLAMASDIRLATQTARMNAVFIRIGLGSGGVGVASGGLSTTCSMVMARSAGPLPWRSTCRSSTSTAGAEISTRHAPKRMQRWRPIRAQFNRPSAKSPMRRRLPAQSTGASRPLSNWRKTLRSRLICQAGPSNPVSTDP